MRLYKYINRIFEAKAVKNGSDFSSFLSDTLTRKQQLIEKCMKQDVPIYIDDPSERSAGVYANLRAVASEAELELRFNANKVIALSERANILSKRANEIAFAAFIVATIPLLVATIALVKTYP